jgi:hypothetical protein
VPLSQLIAVASARWRIEEDHQLSKQVADLDAGQVIRWKSWHRRTAISLLVYIYLTVAVASQREHHAGSDLDAGLIPITVPELLRLLHDTVIPPPRRDPGPTGCTGRNGDAATSTAPAKLTRAGTPTPREHHDHNELQLPYMTGSTGRRFGINPHGPYRMRLCHENQIPPHQSI